MVKVDIGPWRSSGIRIFSMSLIAFPDLCFHDTLACGLDRGGRWFLCQPLQSPDIFEAYFAADTAEDERALTARVVDVGGKVQFVGLITGVCSVYMWLLRSSDQKVAQGAVALGAVLGIRTDEIILARNLPRGLSVRYALQGTIREIGNVDGRQLLYIDVGRRLTAKTTLDAVEKLGLEVGDEVIVCQDAPNPYPPANNISICLNIGRSGNLSQRIRVMRAALLNDPICNR
jgi:molybdopterin-binding protein